MRCCRALLFLSAFWVATAFSAAPTVLQLVNQFDSVNYSNILADTLYTRQGMNRFAVTGAQHDPCRDAISNEFVRAGMTPYMDYFQFQDSNNVTRTACNIVAVKPGVQNPYGEVYIAGAHYDSKSNPGADDNATGVAAILEMARIFSPHQFAKTMVFVAFDCEEIYDYGAVHRRLGSTHYAEQHQTDNIVGMVSVDMIGHEASATPNTAWLYGYPSSTPVTNKLGPALIQYGGLSVTYRTTSPNLSDHVAFYERGFASCLLIESSFTSPSNPFYHTSGDYVEQPGYIGWEYVGRMAKGTIGYFAEQLQPVDIVPRAISLLPASGGGMELTFAGLAGCQYAVEMCTNLVQPIWRAVITNTASSNSVFQYIDAGTASRSRTFYRARFVSGAQPASVVDPVIVDNSAATLVGAWATGISSTDKFRTNYVYANPGTGAGYAEFRPIIAMSGNYKVYEWHPQGGNRTTAGEHIVKHATGQQAFLVNQQVLGGQWNLLGTFPFNAGTSGYIRITDKFTPSDTQVVLADAVRFEYVPPSN